MTKLQTLFILVGLVVIGCKGKSDEKAADPSPKTTAPATTTTATTTTAPTVAGSVLVLAPATLTGDEGGKPMTLSIDAAGNVTENGKQLATVTPAGELKVGDKVVAMIDAAGKVTIPGEPGEVLTIREDGAVLGKDGKVMSEVGADGTLTGPIADEAKSKTTVTGDKAGRRALMFALLGVEQPVK
ncbi:MAG: hypothetical protein H0T89_27250 [Deltaproteobacteria bacterium]|nr:hypothetical protein [Deltaproteobacteria bacterium]MDQ3296441.1 hypothetical protein [Myxococcota bacterium]